MRAPTFFLFALLSIALLADLHAAWPRVRAALIGNGPNALISYGWFRPANRSRWLLVPHEPL